MALPVVEIFGKKVILLNGYKKREKLGSENVRIGSIVDAAASTTSDQKARCRRLRLYRWKVDARSVVSSRLSKASDSIPPLPSVVRIQ